MAQCFLAKSGGGSGGNLKEIWSNPNPQDPFTSGTINIPISDVMLIECCYSNTQNDIKCTFLLSTNSTNFAIPNGSSFVKRSITKLENGISFGEGFQYSGRFMDNDDLYLIPYKIYTI